MYGDTTVIRRLAGGLREQATDIRAEARALHGRLELTQWEGATADHLRAVAMARLVELNRNATRHDEAGDAIDRHADEVDELKELIADLERRATRLIDLARDRLAALAQRALDAALPNGADRADELLARFMPPPSGHKDWLDVDLPGLR